MPLAAGRNGRRRLCAFQRTMGVSCERQAGIKEGNKLPKEPQPRRGLLSLLALEPGDLRKKTFSQCKGGRSVTAQPTQ